MTASYDFAAPTAISITSVETLYDYATDSDIPQSVVNLLTIAADHEAAVQALRDFAAKRGISAPDDEQGVRDALLAAGFTVALRIDPTA